MEVLGFDIVLHEGVYMPREDSHLTVKTLKGKIPKDAKVLDVGSGSGILAMFAAKSAKEVVAVDINPAAVECTKENAEKNEIENLKVLESDLFQNVEGKYDIIIFNAPYLPVEDEGMEAKAWSGGPTGRRQIERFMGQVSPHLTDKGKIYLVISSLTGLQATRELIQNHAFTSKVLTQEKLPWELIYVLEIAR